VRSWRLNQLALPAAITAAEIMSSLKCRGMTI
jgi:hypothetical protein